MYGNDIARGLDIYKFDWSKAPSSKHGHLAGRAAGERRAGGAHAAARPWRAATRFLRRRSLAREAARGFSIGVSVRST